MCVVGFVDFYVIVEIYYVDGILVGSVVVNGIGEFVVMFSLV